jgi:tetratricopeptide (TPR) repeat protein
MTLSPRHQRYADRLRELVEEGQSVAKLVTDAGRHATDIEPYAPLHAWFAKAIAIIEKLLGSRSYHFSKMDELRYKIQWTGNIYEAIGVLEGALDDLEKGYLTGQEFLITAEVFDSVLEQAKHLNDTGYKDPAAVLMRVVLEDALKRLAREESIDDSQKASVLNDELKGIGRYSKPQWRLIQACLDVGNAAAHGRFDECTADEVAGRIEDVERFLAAEFRA